MDLANYNFNKDLVIEKLYKVTDNPDESMIIFFENRFDYITNTWLNSSIKRQADQRHAKH